MANRFEPKVTIKRIDTSVSATINATRATTYIGLEAETGPYDLQEITSTKNLINTYSTKSKPGVSDGVTMLHAGKFTEGFVAHCLRVNKDKIHVGIDSVGNTLFFDDEYNLIDELTNINLTVAQKDISKQSLVLIIDGEYLYYNTNASTDEDNKMTYSIYSNKAWTESTNDYKSLISGWDDDKKVLIDATDTDKFLDLVYKNGLITNPRFISYTNFSDRILMLSGRKISDARYDSSSDLQAYLVQASPEFTFVNTTDESNALITADNNGVDDNVSSVSEAKYDTDKVDHNRMFNKFSDISTYSPNNQIVFNGVQYYSIGNAPGSIASDSISTQLVSANTDVYLRDMILSALNGIYDSSAKTPSSYIDQSVVIAAPAGKIWLATDSDGKFISQATGDLSGLVTLEIVSYGTDTTANTSIWQQIPTYDSSKKVTASQGNLLRINFKGNASVLANGSVDLLLASYVEGKVVNEYTKLSFKIGNANTPGAISVDLLDKLATTDTIINAIVPNLIASYSELGWTEKVPTPTTTAEAAYYCSNVRDVEINLSNVTCSWTGYTVNTSEILSKVQNQCNLKSVFTPQADCLSMSTDDGTYYFLINGNIYYNKTIPSIDSSLLPADVAYVPIGTVSMTASEFISELKKKLYEDFKMALSNEGTIIINGTYEKWSKTSGTTEILPCDSRYIKCTWFNSKQSSEALFAVVQKFTSKASLSKFTIDIDDKDSEVIYLTNEHNGTSNDDTISFNSTKVNGYGVNIYYDKFNAADRAFHITQLNDEGAVSEFTTAMFGKEITPKKATISDYQDALDTLRDIEFKPLFLFDAGLCNTQYYKSLATFAEEVHAIVPVSIPDGSMKDATDFKSALGFDTEEVCYDGWQRDIVFGDVGFNCCPGYYYLQLVLTNTNSVSREFEPIFHKQQGRVQTSDPVRLRTKAQRETLLDANINSIVRNKTDGYSYFNMNYTNQSYESDFSEEQNVRISNKIAHIADQYIDLNVLGKYHTVVLHNKVQETLTNLINEGIMANRVNNTANSFRVVCDETNNDLSSRKLVVDIYVSYGHSIIEALVYSRTETLEG